MSDLNRQDYFECLGLLKYYPQTNPRAQNQPDLQRYGEIFAAWLEGSRSYSQIGREYGIGRERIRQIIYKTTEMLKEVFESCKVRMELG